MDESRSFSGTPVTDKAQTDLDESLECRHSRFQRVVAGVVLVAQLAIPINAIAAQPAPAGSAGIAKAADGQSLGAAMLSSGNTLPSLNEGRPNATGSGQNQFYVQEFFPGTDSASRNDLANKGNAENSRESAKAARRSMNESGCRTTSFEFVSSGPVLKVRAVSRLLRSDPATGMALRDSVTKNILVNDTPIAWSSAVNINSPTLGFSTIKEERIGPSATTTTPGTVLIYELTPFPGQKDGTVFTTNHRVTSGSGSISHYGNLKDGYTTQGSASGQVTIEADQYRVTQDWAKIPAGAGCTPDPATCIVSGVNFCSGPATGVFDVFAYKQRSLNKVATLITDSAYSPKHVSRSNPDIMAIVNSSAPVLDGTHPVYNELGVECSETKTVGDKVIKTTHVPNIQTCHNMRFAAHRDGCDGRRQLGFTPMQSAVVLRIGAWERIKSAIPNSNPVQYTYSVVPATWEGPVNINYATLGGASSWDTTGPTTEGKFLHYDATPFGVSGADHFTINHRISGGGASATVSSFGSTADNWTTVADVSASGMSTIEVSADLYHVALNTITGCENYLSMVADQFCQGEMVCTEDRGPCTTVDGVSFCEGSGPARGITELIKKWGPTDSQSDIDAVGGGAVTPVGKLCWAAHGKPMTCDFQFGDAGCYTSLTGQTVCNNSSSGSTVPPGSPAGWASNFGNPEFKDDCAVRNFNGVGLFSNPACQLQSTSSCVGDARGLFSGECYAYDVAYDCGEDLTVTLPGETAYSNTCSGPIRCMGTECHNVKAETNTEFATVVGVMNGIDQMQHDMICAETGEPPTKTTTVCTPLIFGGKEMGCKQAAKVLTATAIAPDCCEEGEKAAAGVSPIAYLQAIMALQKLATTTTGAAVLANVPGYSTFVTSFKTIAESASASLEMAITPTVTNIATGVNSAMGKYAPQITKDMAFVGPPAPAAEAAGKEYLSGASPFYSSLMEQLSVFVLQILGPEMGGAVMAVAASYMNGGSLASAQYALDSAWLNAGFIENPPVIDPSTFNMVQNINIVFMAYSIIRLIGQIVFACKSEDIEFAVQKKMGNCTHVGKRCNKIVLKKCVETKSVYCCYKTPLSRIFAEQLRKNQNIGGGMGDAKNPNCRGMSIQDLQSADWSRVDLSEWVARLQAAGLAPDN
jgi:conjugal transfer mating pair stabilization protein TraN